MSSTKIYLVEILKSGELYIGKTKNPDKRRSSHRKAFGDIRFTVIDEISSLDKRDWKPLEIFWIDQFRQWGFKLRNKNKGGGGLDQHSYLTKQTIGDINRGRSQSKESNIKRSQALKGRPKPEGFGTHSKVKSKEWLENISKALTGKVRSQEAILKQSETMKGRVPWNKGKRYKIVNNKAILN